MGTNLQAYFSGRNTSPRFELHFPFGWYAHGRQPVFADRKMTDVLAAAFQSVTQRYDYHVLQMEIEPVAVRGLLSLRPETSPSAATRAVKGNLATEVRNQLSRSNLWSRGWFVRSVGHCSNDVIRRYVSQQYDHHQATPIDQPEAAAKAKWHHPGDSSAIRKIAHAAFEYNVHVVLVTRRRFEFLDMQVAEALVDYWRRVCDKRQWLDWDIEVVWNHAHLFLGLNPTDEPGEVALSLMNDSAWFLEQRYGAAMRAEKMTGVWQPSYYVGTAGSATTAQVKAFLQQMRVEG